MQNKKEVFLKEKIKDYVRVKDDYLKKGFVYVELDLELINSKDGLLEEVFNRFALSILSEKSINNLIKHLAESYTNDTAILIKNPEQIKEKGFEFLLQILKEVKRVLEEKDVRIDIIIFEGKSATFVERDMTKYPLIKENFSKKSFNLIELDFKKIKKESEIFESFSRQLKFPSYFGRNWDALDECITDLMWLSEKKTVVLIKNFELLKDADVKKLIISVLKHAKEFWSKYNVEFDVILFEKELEEQK